MTIELIRRRLLPREQVVWEGRPASGLLFASRDILLIPLSLVWLAYTVFWAFTATTHNMPLFFKIWGVAFVAIGLFFAFGRFAVDIWLRRRMYYAVTDRRILIMRDAPFPSFVSLDLDRLPGLMLSDERGTRGTVRFGPAASAFGKRASGSWISALDSVPQLVAIEDGQRVFDLIVKASQPVRET